MMDDATKISTSHTVPVPPTGSPDAHSMTVLQVGRLITGDQQSLCKIRTISAAGIMAHATVPLSVGQKVVVGFRTSHLIAGRVTWTRDELVGIEFFEPADIDALFAAQRRAVSGRFLPESVRLDVHGACTIEIDNETVIAELFDISLSGAKVTDMAAFMIGARIILSVEGLPARSGYIRWRRDGRAGIAFNLSMPFEVLANWAIEQRPRVTFETLRQAG